MIMRSGKGEPHGTGRALASPLIPVCIHSRLRIHRQLTRINRVWMWIVMTSCLSAFIVSKQVTILGITFMVHQVERRRRIKKLASLSAAQFLDWLCGWIRDRVMLSLTDLF